MSNWSDESITGGLVVSDSTTHTDAIADAAIYWTGSAATGYIPIQQMAFEAIESAYQHNQNSDYVAQLEERVQCLEEELAAITTLLSKCAQA